MSESEQGSRSERPDRGGGAVRDVEGLMGRAQWLADAVHPWDGYPLDWYVEAWLIGDLGAMAAARLLESPDEESHGGR